jgi:hypothetical protein
MLLRNSTMHPSKFEHFEPMMPPMVKSLHISPGLSGLGCIPFCAARSHTVRLKRPAVAEHAALYATEQQTPKIAKAAKSVAHLNRVALSSYSN